MFHPKQNTYTGRNTDDYVTLKNEGFFDPEPSLKIRNHSPDGFSWGYCGSGCAQLALGILLEEFGAEVAQRYYQEFKQEVIAGLPNAHGAVWTLTSSQVREWLENYLRKAYDKGQERAKGHPVGSSERLDAIHRLQEVVCELNELLVGAV